MRRADFEAMVRSMAREVPDRFTGGIVAVEVTGKTVPHPTRRGVYTLGECVPHAFGGPDDEGPTLRSTILLHYGSFAALAADRDDFDWREEAWETLTHELRHHLEWRSRVGALEKFDEAVEANYARIEGAPFAPLFYLDGERIAGSKERGEESVYKVEDDVFIDRLMPSLAWRRAAGSRVSFLWHGRAYSVPLPAKLPDVLFLMLQGVEPEPAGDLVLVVRRRPGARDLLRRTAVGRAEARARPERPRR